MDEARAWMRQSLSDLGCACCLVPQAGMGCHTAAKTQQCVEKIIKAFLRSVRIDFKWDHAPLRYILDSLKRFPSHQKDPVWHQISRLLNIQTRESIENLEKIAPAGMETQRNTEYPFIVDGQWVSPCDAKVFPQKEINGFLKTAKQISSEFSRFIAASERKPA